MVGMKVKSADLVERRRGCIPAQRRYQVSGLSPAAYDLIAEVLLKDDFGLLRFFTEEVATVDDVQDFETFVVYKSYGLKVPYIL